MYVISCTRKKVQRQYLGDVSVLKAIGDTVGAAQAAKEWKERAAAWMQKHKREQADAKSKKKPKLARKKSFYWGVTLHNLLEKSTGYGLDHFVITTEMLTNSDPHLWPYLGISPDQGPDGLCMSYFLRYKAMVNCEMYFDPSHGTWRDQEAAMKCVKLMSFAYLFVVVLNLLHGPWDSNSRYAQIMASTDEYMSLMQQGDPLLQSYLPELLEELGLQSEADDPLIGQKVLRKIRGMSAAQTKGTQVKMRRFANFVDAAEQFDQMYTWFTMRLVYLSLQEGLVSAESMEEMVGKVEIANNAGDAEHKQPMNRSNDPIRKFREASKNNCHLSLQLLCDPRTRGRLRVLYIFVAPIRKWYGKQSRHLRSCPALVDWLRDQCRDGLDVPLRETLGLLRDASALQRIGMGPRLRDSQLTADHPLVAEQNEMASLAATYVLHLTSARAKRTLYLTAGWTGQQVKFIDESAEVQEQAAQRLLSQQAAYEAAGARTEAFWVKLRRRSVLNLAPTTQLLRMLQANGGTVSDRMKATVLARISGIGQSKVCEDSIGTGRSLEEKNPNKLQVPPRVLWESLIDQKIASEKFKFKEPDWSNLVAPTGSAAKLPDDLYLSKMRDAPKWMGKVVSSKAGDWFTAGAAGGNIVFADLELLVEAHTKGRFSDIADGCGMSLLAKGDNLALLFKGRWHFSLGDVCGVAALGWPAIVERGSLQRPRLLRPDLAGSPEWLLLYGKDTLALTYEWVCPMAAVLEGLVREKEMAECPRICAAVRSGPRPVLEEAAMQAFWQFSSASLTWLCKYKAVRLPSSASFFEKLQALIKSIMPRMDDEAILGVIEKRFVQKDIFDEVFYAEDAGDLVDEKDKQDFGRAVDGWKAAAREREDLKQTFTVKKRAIREASDRKRTRGGQRKDPPPPEFESGTAGTNVRRQSWAALAGEISQADAQLLCPSPIRIYKDMVNCRWQGYFPGVGSRSRGFMAHDGPNNALRLILQWAWTEILCRKGFTLAQCPLEGLFEAAPQAEAVEGGAAAASSRG